MTAARCPRCADRGLAALELVLVTPILIAMLLLVVGLGRMAHARGQLEGAAREAARAASLQTTPAGAVHAGEQAARALLANQRITCRSFGVRVDVTNHRPGGLVTSTVSCATSLADLGLSGLPVARTFMARSTAPIETYRSDTLGFANSEG